MTQTLSDLLYDLEYGTNDCPPMTGSFGNAIRSVIKLHKPRKMTDKWTVCAYCFNHEGSKYRSYPCPTLKAIEKELQ
jgi:hypothetical protein